MNKDINTTLQALVPLLRMNGYSVTRIEAVHDWYRPSESDREYRRELAEIAFDNGALRYADIGCDANLTACYDVLAVLLELKPRSTVLGRIARGVYPPAGA